MSQKSSRQGKKALPVSGSPEQGYRAHPTIIHGGKRTGHTPPVFLEKDGAGWWERAVSAAPEEQKRTVKKAEETKTTGEKAPGSNITEKAEKLKEDMERIIDEIDEVLEENAEDFVRNYIQRGGQ